MSHSEDHRSRQQELAELRALLAGQRHVPARR
jgi:hypothetical protein